MHNRVRDGVDSREIALLDSTVLVPLVAVILFLALYPQFALSRSEKSVKAAVGSAYVFADRDLLSPFTPCARAREEGIRCIGG